MLGPDYVPFREDVYLVRVEDDSGWTQPVYSQKFGKRGVVTHVTVQRDATLNSGTVADVYLVDRPGQAQTVPTSNDTVWAYAAVDLTAPLYDGPGDNLGAVYDAPSPNSVGLIANITVGATGGSAILVTLRGFRHIGDQ